MPRLDLTHRANLTELMDGPCSYKQLRGCLRDIAKVNWLTFAYRPTLAWLDSLVAENPTAPLRIVDVGCGYGDMLRRIERWARRRRLQVSLVGIDLNLNAIRAAREATRPGSRIAWIPGDAYSCEPSEGIDVVISSLMTHHLQDEEIVTFLEWMEATARRGWFINDLHRQALPYHAFRIFADLSGWHPFVLHDGPVSILRSFVPEDWHRLTAEAGLPASDVTLSEWRPARLCVGRVKASLHPHASASPLTP